MSNSDSQEPKKYARIFVAECDNCDEWIDRHASIDKIKNDDFFLLLKAGKHYGITADKQGIIDELSKHGCMLDCEGISDENYRNYICERLKVISDKDTKIIFVALEELHTFLKERLKNTVADVRASSKLNNALATRTKNRSKTEKDSKKMKMGIGKQKKEKSNEFEELEDAVSDIAANYYNSFGTDSISPSIHMPGDSQNASKESNEDGNDSKNLGQDDYIQGADSKNKYSKNADNEKNDSKESAKKVQTEQKETGSGKEDASSANEENGSSSSASKNNTSNLNGSRNAAKTTRHRADASKTSSSTSSDTSSGASIHKGTPMGAFPRGGRKGPAPSPSPCDNKSMQEIEDLIFASSIEKKDNSKKYTKLDDNKAQLILSMRDRLIQNIEKFAKSVTEYNFSDDDYLLLITSFLKSTDFNDFTNSWECVMPGKPLGINETVYLSIRKEAVYYNNLCNMLYMKDRWC